MSYGDAQKLLAALGGPVAPEAIGAARLPLTYHIGGDDSGEGPPRGQVRLVA